VPCNWLPEWPDNVQSRSTIRPDGYACGLNAKVVVRDVPPEPPNRATTTPISAATTTTAAETAARRRRRGAEPAARCFMEGRDMLGLVG
jgi:hypothetical protein